MPQLHCYVSEDIAQKAQARATQANLSLSRYLAELLKRDTTQANAWPEGYFELFGSWQGAPLERPPQGELLERLALE